MTQKMEVTRFVTRYFVLKDVLHRNTLGCFTNKNVLKYVLHLPYNNNVLL